MLKISMIKSILKFIFAGAILYWLIVSGKLELSLISKSITDGPIFFIVFLTLFTQGIFVAFRYSQILKMSKIQNLEFIQILKINWIGMFFSSFLPGAVTGDFIKLYYLKKINPNFKKSFLLSSALLDRIFGLLGLLFTSGIFSLIYFNEMIHFSAQIKHLILVNFILFLGGICLFALFLLPSKFQKIFLHLFFKIPLIGPRIVEILEHLFFLRTDRLLFLKCFIISSFNQFMNVICFYFLTRNYFHGHLELGHAFTFIPLGLIAVAIPISPSGLGVGHALFQNLFALVGVSNGASLFNLFFICNLLVNLTGVIPYLMAPKINEKISIEDN